MADDALIRRQNLQSLGHGPNDLVRLAGNTYSYWRDLLAGNKSFGEKAARSIEEKLHMPRGWLDQPHGELDAKVPAVTGAFSGVVASEPGAVFRTPTQEDMAFLEDFLALPDDEQTYYRNEIRIHADKARAHVAKVLARMGLAQPQSPTPRPVAPAPKPSRSAKHDPDAPTPFDLKLMEAARQPGAPLTSKKSQKSRNRKAS